MLGQEIRSLLGFLQTPNEYTIDWDGRNNNGRKVSSGVYIYVLEINFEVSKIKKMVKL